jgi:hypothetical protein
MAPGKPVLIATFERGAIAALAHEVPCAMLRPSADPPTAADAEMDRLAAFLDRQRVPIRWTDDGSDVRGALRDVLPSAAWSLLHGPRHRPQREPREPPIVHLSCTEHDAKWAERVANLLDQYDVARVLIGVDGRAPAVRSARPDHADLPAAAAVVPFVTARYLRADWAADDRPRPGAPAAERAGPPRVPWVLVSTARWQDSWIARYAGAWTTNPLDSLPARELESVLLTIARRIIATVLPHDPSGRGDLMSS